MRISGGFFASSPVLHFPGGSRRPHVRNFKGRGRGGGDGRMVGSSAHQSTCNAILYSLGQVLHATVAAIAGASLRERACGRDCRRCRGLVSVIRRGTARPIRRRHGAVEAGDDIEADRCVSREAAPLGQQCAGLHRPEQENLRVEGDRRRGATSYIPRGY